MVSRLSLKPYVPRLGVPSILIYGPSGAGKTVLAASAARVEELSPVLFLDFEPGTLSILPLAKEVGDAITIYHPTSWSHLQEFYQDLVDRKQYRTVVFDPLTVAVDLCGEQLAREDNRETASLHDWMTVTSRISRFLRAFQRLGICVIATAHAQRFQNEVMGVSEVGPSFPGKMAQWIPARFDIVAFLSAGVTTQTSDKKKGEKAPEFNNVLITGLEPRVVAKDRTWSLGRRIEMPTMGKIHWAIAQRRGSESTEVEDEDSSEREEVI